MSSWKPTPLAPPLSASNTTELATQPSSSNQIQPSASKGIKPIDATSIHRITSGQVVVDLQGAVKELVENSLDAGAGCIEVRFTNYGLDSITVIDDGSGIAENDWETVALKHHTSKLASYIDLEELRTFGFRGEALSALCGICEKVTVSTATSSTAPMGISLELDGRGKVIKKTPVAKKQGTTVTLSGLFAPLPVRRKELERNIKREFGKALGVLGAYALGVWFGVGDKGEGARMVVTNIIGEGATPTLTQSQGKGKKGKTQQSKKTTHIQTSCPLNGWLAGLKMAVSSLWGPRAVDGLVELDFRFEVERDVGKRKDTSDKQGAIPITIRGLVSNPSASTALGGSDKQLFYINSRPCTLPKVGKIFNEVFKACSPLASPVLVIDLSLPTDAYDVNVTPDKRTIFLHSEGRVLAGLKMALEEALVGAQGSRMLTVREPTQMKAEKETVSQPTNESAPASEVESKSELRVPQEALFLPDDEEEPAADEEVVINVDMSAMQKASAKKRREDEDEERMAKRPRVEEAEHNEADDGEEPIGSVSVSPHKPPPRTSSISRIQTKTFTKMSVAPSYSSSSSGKVGSKITRLSENVQTTLEAFVMRPSGGGKGAEVAEADDSDDDDIEEVDEEEEEVSEDAEQRDDDQTPLAAGDEEDEKMDHAIRSSTPTTTLEHPPPPAIVTITNPLPSSPTPTPTTTILTPALPSSSSSSSSSHSPFPSVDARIGDQDQDLDRPHYPEILRTTSDTEGDVTIKFDLGRVEGVWEREREMHRGGRVSDMNYPPSIGMEVDADTDADADVNVEDKLSRIISKEDFGRMEVVGQFNLGFVIVRLRKGSEGKERAARGEKEEDRDDLFIVDQHAADEKWNFEQLQANTRIESQRLIRPRSLELTASDELVALENLDVLRVNGFEVVADGHGHDSSYLDRMDVDLDDGEESDDRAETADGDEDIVQWTPSDGPGKEEKRNGRLQLVAHPISKNTVFDLSDLEELLHLMRDRLSASDSTPGETNKTKEMVRCTKARAMFASRACRKSVMVGMPLTNGQMTSVIRHMGTMDQPWNCPHGRPTMRHLVDIRPITAKKVAGGIWEDEEER